MTVVEEQDLVITDSVGRYLMHRLVRDHVSPLAVVKEEGLAMISDEATIRAVVEKVVAENAKVVEEYRNGEAKAFNYLVGQTAKQLKGRGSPAVITKMIKDEVDK
jgi:aspartyl-tRNA(Asn)/glutamyl-tRNA(Gln) amidotransferase subunit B